MKLNLGCGAYPFEGWTNYDMIGHPGVVRRDLTSGLPEPDNSVSLIFSEHFLEHIDQPKAIELLRHCHRVLRPGGEIQIVMPDLKKVCDMYMARDFEGMKAIGLSEANQGSLCRFVNQAMRAWGHQFLWDVEELSSVLFSLGFRLIAEVPMDARMGYRKIPTDLAVRASK